MFVMEEFPLQLDSGATLVRTNSHLDVRPSSTPKPGAKALVKVWKIPLKNVLWARITNSILDIAAVLEKRGVVRIDGRVREGGVVEAEKWTEELMLAAYAGAGVKPQRRFLVVVNPYGGPGKARAIYKKQVEPILVAAHCTYRSIFTEYYQHAIKIGEELEIDELDGILSVSGDGVIHEIYNGMAKHKTPRKAFRVPIAPIPAGSANGMCLNLLGLKDGASIVAATLNAIKGRPMALDICSIVQDGKRTFSFMSQCLGLMADLDLGTEHLRILGSNRFVYGYIRGIVTLKKYPYSILIKARETDKHKMSEALRENLQNMGDASFIDSREVEDESNELPPLQYADDDASDWIKFEDSVMFAYGGNCPYVGPDLMQFPVSLPNDGAVDLTIQCALSRTAMLSGMDQAEKGSNYWHDKNKYYKAQAYRIKPLKKQGYLSIDGEKYPFGEFHVEVHRGLGAMMSCYGHYVTEENIALQPPPV